MLAAALRNNAVWCDAVCGGGEIFESHWLTRTPAPRLYPNLVTLTPDVEPVMRAIDDLQRSLPPVEWAVKDSFAVLQLDRAGFRLAFEAEWLGRPAADVDMPRDWHRVASERELHAWTDVAFPRRLLQRDDVAFLVRRDAAGAITAGAVANLAAGVVGLSNVFGTDARREGVDAATHVFRGVPLVGYEHGDAVHESRALGFASLGRLRVWSRDA